MSLPVQIIRPDSMLAIARHRYGSPACIEVKHLPIPTPRRNEVLVRVRAVSLNASDWEALTGSPAYVRIFGLFRPRFQVLGSDLAGVVEAVGPDVIAFQVGDQVLGDAMGVWGTLAEYACVRESMLVRKPESLAFEVAATLPQSGVIALQGIVQQTQVIQGARVLINGGGGGAGCFSIQLAKRAGAHVTAVDSHEKMPLMRELGADEVLDYRETDFADGQPKYDLILDLVASRSLFQVRRSLRPRGRYLIVGGSVVTLLKTLVLGSLLSLFSRRKLALLAIDTRASQLSQVAKLCVDGHLRPHVERTYALRDAAEALEHQGGGKTLGKVVVVI